MKVQLVYRTHWSWRKIIGIPLLGIMIGFVIIAFDDILSRARGTHLERATTERSQMP